MLSHPARRIMLVLRAAGERSPRSPGPSDTQVAEPAGMSDPGQISKRLARRAEYGPIVNGQRQACREREANAWRLTEKGDRLRVATMRTVNGNLIASAAHLAGPQRPQA